MVNTIEGINSFKMLSREQKTDIMRGIGQCLDVCVTCPLKVGKKTSALMRKHEVEELCGSCLNYKRLRRLGASLPQYDLTREQKELLIKCREEGFNIKTIVRLYRTGVEKSVLRKAVGINSMTAFNNQLRKNGVIMQNGEVTYV